MPPLEGGDLTNRDEQPPFLAALSLAVVAPGGRIKKALRTDEHPLFLQLYFRARTFKCVWGPGIDAKE